MIIFKQSTHLKIVDDTLTQIPFPVPAPCLTLWKLKKYLSFSRPFLCLSSVLPTTVKVVCICVFPYRFLLCFFSLKQFMNNYPKFDISMYRLIFLLFCLLEFLFCPLADVLVFCVTPLFSSHCGIFQYISLDLINICDFEASDSSDFVFIHLFHLLSLLRLLTSLLV